MTEDSGSISNRHIGDTSGAVIQVGIVHGDLNFGEEGMHRAEAGLVASVTTRHEQTVYDYEGTLRLPVFVVHLLVEVFTAQAVVLHRLRPVVVRRGKQFSAVPAEVLPPREFRVRLDLPEPLLYEAGVSGKSPWFKLRRSPGHEQFPFYVTRSAPEYFVITPKNVMRPPDELVEWRLELDWSSLGQQGTVVIDDDGAPFLSGC